MLGLILYVPATSARNGPEIDLLRYKAIWNLSEARIAMLTGNADSWNDLVRTSDLATLISSGFTITSAPGFHLGFVAYNIRDTATIQAYYRPEISYWPLHDAEFRHALFHCWDQSRIIQSYYGFVATPIPSLVPPAQSKYYNPNAPQHPYKPGNPFTSPAGEHSSVGFLKAKGYTFVDMDSSGTVTNTDYWQCPDGSPLPLMTIWTPLGADCGTTRDPLEDFIQDLRAIGLAAIWSGGHGMAVMGRDYSDYLDDVYGTTSEPGGRFDAFVHFYYLGKIPYHLYTFCHSNQDTHVWSGRGNAPGINDTTVDALVETVKFSLDVDAVEGAAKQAQEYLYDPMALNADSFALAYMMLYSRTYFNSYNPRLTGIINSHGYGSKNIWTFLNWNWMPGFERVIDSRLAAISILADPPQNFNPLEKHVTSEWDILNHLYDGLINRNPYNHNDIPWLATDWTITQTATGMEIDFTLRDDIMWQDGTLFTAHDVEFCLEFLRDRQVPRCAETTQVLADVAVADATHFTINATEAGLALFYQFEGLAAMLPPQVWDRAWTSDEAVLDYDPTEPYNTAPGYSPGMNPPPTNLFGTGPWTFQFYSITDMECDLYANRDYFMEEAEVQALLSNMFWEVGDYSRDGRIDVVDLAFVSIAFGSMTGDPQYDPNADFNSDGIVDMKDLSTCGRYLMWQKEYP